jgi:hypothetical protein
VDQILTAVRKFYILTQIIYRKCSALTGGTNAPEYKAALSIASQSPAPRTFAISRKDGDEDYDEALSAIKLIDNDWYGLTIASRTAADVLLAAAGQKQIRKFSGLVVVILVLLTMLFQQMMEQTKKLTL